MPFVKIEQDCRVLGLGFSPDEHPVEVEDAVAEALVQEKLGVVVDAPKADDSGGSGDDGSGSGQSGSENS